MLFDPAPIWNIDDKFNDFEKYLIDLEIVHTNLESFNKFYDKYYNKIHLFLDEKDVQIILNNIKIIILGNNLQSTQISNIFNQ